MAQVNSHFATVQAAVEVACPAMAGVSAIADLAVVEAPEEMVGKVVTQMHLILLAEVVAAEPSSMVQTVHRREVVGATSAVAQAAATRIVAIMPLAPAAAAVEEDGTTPPSTHPLHRMEAMAPTEEEEAALALTLAILRAEVVAMAGSAAAEVPQGRLGPS